VRLQRSEVSHVQLTKTQGADTHPSQAFDLAVQSLEHAPHLTLPSFGAAYLRRIF